MYDSQLSIKLLLLLLLLLPIVDSEPAPYECENYNSITSDCASLGPLMGGPNVTCRF